MGPQPRILVVEGNPRANCDRAVEAGTMPAGERYVTSLQAVCPGAQIDKVYGAEADFALPDGAEIASYDGVVMGGSGLHVYNDEIRVTRQIEFARAVLASGVPFLGSCWGLQVAVMAAGGIVQPSHHGREIGIARKIRLTPEGLGHPLYEGKPAAFDSPCIHLDEVTHVPDGATVLASNNHSRIQALSFTHRGGTFWGVQYHPEFDLFHMAKLAVMYVDIMLEGGFYRSVEDARAHSEKMIALHEDPSRFDLAWFLGIERDVLDPDIRLREIRNWIERMVLPRKATRS